MIRSTNPIVMNAMLAKEVADKHLTDNRQDSVLTSAIDEFGRSVIRYLARPCKGNLRELIARRRKVGELQRQMTGQEDDFNYAALEAALERLP